jgi:hypothetical protein
MIPDLNHTTDPQRRRPAPPERARPRGIFPGIGQGIQDSTEVTHTARPKTEGSPTPTTITRSEAEPDPCLSRAGEHPGSAQPVKTPEGAGTTAGPADSAEVSDPVARPGGRPGLGGNDTIYLLCFSIKDIAN